MWHLWVKTFFLKEKKDAASFNRGGTRSHTAWSVVVCSTRIRRPKTTHHTATIIFQHKKKWFPLPVIRHSRRSQRLISHFYLEKIPAPLTPQYSIYHFYFCSCKEAMTLGFPTTLNLFIHLFTHTHPTSLCSVCNTSQVFESLDWWGLIKLELWKQQCSAGGWWY